MNMTKTMLALVGAALMTAGAFADEPTITLRRFQQRYPWNGLVDIDYTVANVPNPEDYYVKFTVSTNGVDTGVIVRSFLDDATLAIASNGSFRVTWDTKADLAILFSTNVSVRADLVVDPGCKGDRSPYAAEFVIIDLTGGATATAYPVAYESIYHKEVARTNYNTAVYKKDKLVLRKVWKGQFKMGSPVGEYGRYALTHMNCETEHEVRLTQDFLLGIFEVTQAQFYRVMGSNPSKLNKNNDGLCPVEYVSHQTIRGSKTGGQVPPTFGNVDSTSFMGKLSERTDLQFDLPTEAQWEYACRAGTTTMTYAGNFTTTPNEVVGSIAWYDNNSVTTHEAGGKIPNGWGFKVEGEGEQRRSVFSVGLGVLRAPGRAPYGRAVYHAPARNGDLCYNVARKDEDKEKNEMATLAMFDGIIIRMNPEKNTRHHKPHIHARYQGAEASFDIASRKMFAGSTDFPRDQQYMVQAWIVRHEAELLANWELLHGEQATFFKIEG